MRKAKERIEKKERKRVRRKKKRGTDWESGMFI